MISKEDVLFGKVAVDLNLITARILEEANKIRLEISPDVKIGEFLVQKGYLYPWDVDEILARQRELIEQQRREHMPATLPSKEIKIDEIASAPESISPSPLPKEDLNNNKPLEIHETSKPIHQPTNIKPEIITSTNVEYLFEAVPVNKKLKEFLIEARSLNASDLHLCVGTPPFIRKFKQLIFLEHPALKEEDTEELIFGSISEAQKRLLLKEKSLDLCLSIDNNERYRTSFYKQIKGFEASFRIISNKIHSFEELKLTPVIKKLTEYHQGLILVGGPSNSGKTTTLAAMIDLINSERSDHIITVEDPIEYVHVSKKCQITQRELCKHTLSFENALKAALREDPDIIMVGEMRNKETMSMAISASETGHLVLGTMPTSSAARTISAVIDFFPPDQQGQIQSMISESLRGIICQQLIPGANLNGLELALEVLLFDTGISALVRQNQIHQLASMMQTGKNKGMKIMDESIMELLNEKKITPESAYSYATEKTKFERFIKKD